MIRCIVCDDDERILSHTVDVVTDLFQKEVGNHTVLGYSDMEELAKVLKSESPLFDVAILDIEMPYYNGIEVAQMLRRINPRCLILFLTSHLEMAPDLYEVDAYRFIPKNEMEKRMKRYIPQVCHTHHILGARAVILDEGTTPLKVYHNDIIIVEKDKKYSLVKLSNGTVHKVRTTLQELLAKIPSEIFVQVDRGLAVNIEYIERIGERELTLKGGQVLPVSRARFSQVKEKIALYWKEVI